MIFSTETIYTYMGQDNHGEVDLTFSAGTMYTNMGQYSHDEVKGVVDTVRATWCRTEITNDPMNKQFFSKYTYFTLFLQKV